MDTNSENVVEVKDKVIERVKVFDKKKLAIIIPIAIILIAAIIVFAGAPPSAAIFAVILVDSTLSYTSTRQSCLRQDFIPASVRTSDVFCNL